MILEIIITTMNEGILKVIKDFFPSEQNVIFLISHQITKHDVNIYEDDVNDFLKIRSDVTYTSFFEKGLSRNRNRSMEVSRGDICMVTDDDIKFKAEAFKKILNSFIELQDADIITYKAEFPDGKPYKHYKSEISRHTKRSSMRVSSFEIAYKRESINERQLRWDEHFGLGGDPYTNHMENIFMCDALDRELKCYLYPETLVIHPFDNSGFNYSDHLVFSKGAAFSRMFGNKALFIDILFAIKKLNYYKKQQTFWNYLKLSRAGIKHFKTNRKDLYD